jgi:RHS repeat-associated protein
VTDPRTKSTTIAYDARNRKISSTNPLTQITQWTYDASSNITTVTRPDTKTEIYTYDSLNRILTGKDADNRVTTLTYWPSGLAKTLLDPKSQLTQFEYNLFDLRTKMIHPNTDYETWAYDTAKNMIDRRAVNGQVQHFDYNNRNRPTAMTWSNSIDWATYGWDDATRLTSANNANSTVTLSYDVAGRLSHDIQNVAGFGTLDVTYSRNNDGKVKQIDVPTDLYSLIIGHDQMGRVSTLTDKWRPSMIEYIYDAASNITQRKNYLNNSQLDTPRDDANRMTQRNIVLGGVTVSSESYTYDPLLLNRLSSVDRTEDGRRDQFGYDFSGQLTSAQYGLVGGSNPQRTVSYNLDTAGNRSSVVDNGVTKNYVTNNLNQYTTGDSSAVTNSTSHAIETYQGLTYSYLNDRQLSSVIGNGNNYSIKYDALGRTVKRTLNSSTTYYFYDGANPILERGAVTASNIFGPGTDEILIRFMVGDINYFYQDQLGSVTHVANFQSGQMVETYRYDAFGAPTIRDGAGNPRSASAINNRFMFTGREWAPGSLGFYEYRARAYHPSLGRFTQPDPIDFGGRDTNLFRYAGNDPVNHKDPSGLQAPEAIYRPVEVKGVFFDGMGAPSSRNDRAANGPGIAGVGGEKGGNGGGGNSSGKKAKEKNPKDMFGIPYTSGVDDAILGGAWVGAAIEAPETTIGGAIFGTAIGGPLGGLVFGLAGLVGGALEGAGQGALLGAAGQIGLNIWEGDY